jgi:hypothetical protein
VNNKIGTSKKIKAVPTAVTVLTTDNFDGHVLGNFFSGYFPLLMPYWLVYVLHVEDRFFNILRL